MGKLNQPKKVGETMVKFIGCYEKDDTMVLQFEGLSGSHLGTLNCYCRSNDFWSELFGIDEPDPKELCALLEEPMMATVSKLHIDKNRPKLIYITKLESVQ